MLITRTSPLTGITRILDLACTDEQFNDWMNGVLAQDAFPDLTADEREFIMSGVTSDEWEAMFGEDE